MRSALLCIKTASLIFALLLLGLGALVVPVSAYANGSLPTNCQNIDGVYVCTDGSTGTTGTNCVTDVSAGTQTCLTGQVGSGTLTSGGIGSLGTGLGSVNGLPSQTTGTGWLSRLTGWIAYAFNVLFTAIAQFFKDLVTYALAVVLGVVEMAIAAIPIPDWIMNNSLGSLLGQTGSIVGFFMTQLQIPASLVLIGAGYAFRLLRKFLTLFQW